MLKITIFYDKESGNLNIASTNKKGRLKVLDENLNWLRVSDNKVSDLKEYINSHEVQKFVVLNNKEKFKLENDLIDELSKITADALDLIIDKTFDEFFNASLKCSILNSFETAVKKDLEKTNRLVLHNLVSTKLINRFSTVGLGGNFVDINFVNRA